jgi:hypothetical protein
MDVNPLPTGVTEPTTMLLLGIGLIGGREPGGSLKSKIICHFYRRGRVKVALPFILVRLRITECTIELNADIGF